MFEELNNSVTYEKGIENMRIYEYMRKGYKI